MRFAIVCMWVSILNTVVQSQLDNDSDINCDSQTYYYDTMIDLCSKQDVLKIRNCHPNWLEGHLSVCPNLHTIDISFSNYTTLGLLHLNVEHLKRLNVSHNNLTELHEYLFYNTKQLTEVDFSHNQIETLHALTFSNVPKLTVVNISHNQIEVIQTVFFDKLPELDILDLSDNKIKWIERGMFIKHSKLKRLNLRNNPIWSLDCEFLRLLNGMTSLEISFENVSFFDLFCANDMEWTTDEDEIIFKNVKTKNELRYPKMNFKHLEVFYIGKNRVQNPLSIVSWLGKSILLLYLSENHVGEVNETTFRGFSNLEELRLSATNLSFAESNPFENLNNLTILDISHNKLPTLNISLFSKTLNNLEGLHAAANHFDNGLEIIRNLGQNLTELNLSLNFIGALNRSTFERFKHFSRLNLSDTHLEHFDVNPFEVDFLDISRNNLKRLNVTLLSDTLNKLQFLHAADNKFENSAEIIEHLGKNLHHLDLSGSYVGKLNESTFQRLKTLFWLTLRRTNLSISDVRPFEALSELHYLDISNNNLKKINFSTSLIFEKLEELNMSENHLTHLDGLTKHSYPELTKLDITNNELSCDYLSTFRKQWERLEMIGGACDHFGINETQIQSDVENITSRSSTESGRIITTRQTESNEEAQIGSSISPKTSESSSSSVVFVVPYSVLIGASAVVIFIIVAVVAVRRWKIFSKNGDQMKVSYRKNKNGEDLVLRSQAQTAAVSKPEDHIYEEIEERERPYDHLRFEFDPMPIATENQHYYNFTLVNRNCETQSQSS